MLLVQPHNVEKQRISLLKRVSAEAHIKAAVFPCNSTTDMWAVEDACTYCKGGKKCLAAENKGVQLLCLKCSCQHKKRSICYGDSMTILVMCT